MSANTVSPPRSGTSTARSTAPIAGSRRQVTSECQPFSVPDVGGIREIVALLEAHDLLRITLLQEGVVLQLTERLREPQLLLRVSC